GYWGRISGYLKRKQPKTCVGVSVVGRERNFAKVSEYKASITAPLTKNQKKAFPEIERTGATVVGKGKLGYPKGNKIKPTKVIIERKR
ncbi:hypothetical protein, partial [Neisseria polysaccharea]